MGRIRQAYKTDADAVTDVTPSTPLPVQISTGGDAGTVNSFDSLAISSSTAYTAFDAAASCKRFHVQNRTGVSVRIGVGATPTEYVLLQNQEQITLLGDPSTYSAQRDSGSGSITLRLTLES